MTNSKSAAVTLHNSGVFHWVGNGFPVRSVFGYNDLGQELSPFLLLDYAAPYHFAAGNEKRGVGEHPHRGFETVTIAYQGEIEHRDSSGGGGRIGPGDVQWMTAASGLVHEEIHSNDFTNQGGMFEMVQLWVNLPAKYKSAKPGYQTLLNKDIPNVEFAGTAGNVRIIAGEFNGSKGAAQTFTPINLWDVSLKAQNSVDLPLPAGHTRAILVLRGEVTINDQQAKDGDLAVLAKEGSVTVTTQSDTKLLVMTGEPINERIVGYGPFVMNSDAEIKQAFEDYKQGKFGTFAS